MAMSIMCRLYCEASVCTVQHLWDFAQMAVCLKFDSLYMVAACSFVCMLLERTHMWLMMKLVWFCRAPSHSAVKSA